MLKFEMEPCNETPITKYLANLERRKSMFLAPSPFDSTPSPSATSPPKTIRTRGPQGIQMKLSFDDTFFGGQDDDESMLHISPQSGSKRRRVSSIFSDDNQNYDELQTRNSTYLINHSNIPAITQVLSNYLRAFLFLFSY